MAPVTVALASPEALGAGTEPTLASQAAVTEMPTTITTMSTPPPTPPTPPFPPLLDSPQVYLPMYPRHFSSGAASSTGSRLPPHYYTQPCKCDLGRQIRYYNHKDREFYYHTAVQVTSPVVPAPAPTLAGEDMRDGEIVLDFGGGGDVSSPSSSPPLPQSPPLPPTSSSPFGLYYDPYGPVVPPRLAPVPPDYHPARQPGGYHHYLYQDNGLCEGIIVVLALLLWLYSFYRLYLVWQNTLNFNESSIQGPQGWDLLVSWVVERIRLRKLALRVPGMTIKRRNQMARRGAGVEVSVVQAAEAAADDEEEEEDDDDDEDDIASEGGGARGKVRTSGSTRATLEFELIERGGEGAGRGGEAVDGSQGSEEAARAKKELHLPLDLATGGDPLAQCQAALHQPPPPHSCDRIPPSASGNPDTSAAAAAAAVVVTGASVQNLASPSPPPPSPSPPSFSTVGPSLNKTAAEMGEAEEKQEEEEEEVAPGDKNGGAVTVAVV